MIWPLCVDASEFSGQCCCILVLFFILFATIVFFTFRPQILRQPHRRTPPTPAPMFRTHAAPVHRANTPCTRSSCSVPVAEQKSNMNAQSQSLCSLEWCAYHHILMREPVTSVLTHKLAQHRLEQVALRQALLDQIEKEAHHLLRVSVQCVIVGRRLAEEAQILRVLLVKAEGDWGCGWLFVGRNPKWQNFDEWSTSYILHAVFWRTTKLSDNEKKPLEQTNFFLVLYNIL